MLKFTKMEGLGNDYIYVDAIHQKVNNPNDLAIKLSDRHFGIGADGLILISKSDKADFKMNIYNTDGTEAEMCGNGIRCVGKFVYDKGLTKKNQLTIETLAGIKYLDLMVDNNKVSLVKVDMGAPILDAERIPVIDYNTEYFDDKLEYVSINTDNDEKFTCVSMGNPHAVCFVNDVDKLDITKIGPFVEKNEKFPQRTNAEFISILNRKEIKMRVWERGVGETLACGTGACASVVASILNGYTDREVMVHLLGGDLKIKWDKESGHVYMTGPARTVFEGEIELDILSV